ncbi:sugar transferase [Rubellimicrobium rubrum]|uniref:sugar transferase n=1 Tax=Rubellimicrobium rubrum TaxID=2585369 RepID=UPI001FE62C05|nr:sugar transferase [Rubellimicrobium rubrum]
MSSVDRFANDPQEGGYNGFYRCYGKRALDLALILAFAPVWVLVVLLLAGLVRLGGGSAFYGHQRVGLHGRVFSCWKIRTMVPNADEILRRHLANDPQARQEWADNFKLVNDPRVTRLGAFLRATSLDELPQLWNVLCGDMSLVGPRPVTTKELERFEGFERVYMVSPPGLTGLWQVSGRNNLEYSARVQLESRYARLCSLRTDVHILFLTVGAVLKRTGH